MEDFQLSDGQTPTLPKGFVPDKKQDNTPPLPKGFVPDKKKVPTSGVSSAGFDFSHGYKPTEQDKQSKAKFDKLEDSFDRTAPKFDLNLLKQYQDKARQELYTYDPNSPAFKQNLQAQKKAEQEAYSGGRSWKNVGTFTARTVFGNIEKDIGDAATWISSKTGYNPMLPTALVTDAIANSAYKQSQKDLAIAHQNQLPGTEGGKFMTGVAQIGSDVVEAAVTPEAEFTKAGKYGSKALKLLFGRFPIQQGVKGIVNGYADTKKAGKTEEEANKESYEQGLKNYAGGVLMDAANIGAGKMTGLGMKSLEDAGLVSGNKLAAGAEKRLVHATAQGIAFSAIPFIQNSLQGKSTELSEVQKQGSFGAIMGIITGHGGDADAAAAKVVSLAPEIDLHNFINTDVPEIIQIHNAPVTEGDLRANSAAQAEQGFNAPDSETKQSHIVQSSITGKGASVKNITNAILTDKPELIDRVNNLGIPDEQKRQVIDKINDVHRQLLGSQIADLDAQIKQYSEKSDDPVKNAENEVNLERATKERDELYSKLKNAIKNDTESTKIGTDQEKEGQPGQQMAERPELEEKGDEGEEGRPQKEPDVTAGAENAPLKQESHAIQEQEPGEGVLRQEGQELGLPQVGERNQVDKEPAGEKEASEAQKKELAEAYKLKVEPLNFIKASELSERSGRDRKAILKIQSEGVLKKYKQLVQLINCA